MRRREGGNRRGGRRQPGPQRLTAACGPFLPWKCRSWPRRLPGASCKRGGRGLRRAGEAPFPSVRPPAAHPYHREAHGRPSSPAPPGACPPRLPEGRSAAEAALPPGTPAPPPPPAAGQAPPWPRRAPTSPKS